MSQLANWINREKITLVIACFTLGGGAIFPWYTLPTEALETFGTSLILANSIRFLVFLLGAILLAIAFLPKSNAGVRLLFWSALIGILLYPYLVVTWSPTVTFLAKAYYEQGQRVTLHVESNFHQVQSQWKQNITLAQSRPLNSIFGLSIKDSCFFQMSSWEELLEAGFGYSNSFFSLIGRGWSLSVIGIAIALLGLYLKPANSHLKIFVKDLGKLLPWVSLLLILIIGSIVSVNIVNHQLDTMYAKGEYSQVIALSKALSAWYPPLRGDEAFLERLAKAGWYSDRPDPALIAFAKGLERYRLDDYNKAEQYFQQAINIQPKLFLARGYLATTVLNQGVDYFKSPFVPNRPLNARFPYKYNFLDSDRSLENPNNYKPSLTAKYCERVLEIFPGHLEALYDLMLARIVNGEFNRSATISQQIIEIQKFFQQPMLALLGQAYLHQSWQSYQEKNLPKAWLQYRQSIDPKTWKESLEAKP